LAYGLIGDAVLARRRRIYPPTLELTGDAATPTEPDPPRLGLRPGRSQAIKPDHGDVSIASPAFGARERTVHQERYNPLKVGYQPQDPRAKVQQDFGVRSVTWLA
jgi:hypothetical protein